MDKFIIKRLNKHLLTKKNYEDRRTIRISNKNNNYNNNKCKIMQLKSCTQISLRTAQVHNKQEQQQYKQT